mmetsp:Transcript_87723/g.246464  ORF Transcript_87723/g.246464 Transcript_87723/m.246464 type:complete len:285 (+) Transcript_87723:259-1113(+)
MQLCAIGERQASPTVRGAFNLPSEPTSVLEHKRPVTANQLAPPDYVIAGVVKDEALPHQWVLIDSDHLLVAIRLKVVAVHPRDRRPDQERSHKDGPDVELRAALRLREPSCGTARRAEEHVRIVEATLHCILAQLRGDPRRPMARPAIYAIAGDPPRVCKAGATPTICGIIRKIRPGHLPSAAANGKEDGAACDVERVPKRLVLLEERVPVVRPRGSIAVVLLHVVDAPLSEGRRVERLVPQAARAPRASEFAAVSVDTELEAPSMQVVPERQQSRRKADGVRA